jgi:hypothetical protein
MGGRTAERFQTERHEAKEGPADRRTPRNHVKTDRARQHPSNALVLLSQCAEMVKEIQRDGLILPESNGYE